MVMRVKELEDESRWFKKIYAEEKLKVEIISEAMQKKSCVAIRICDNTGHEQYPPNAKMMKERGASTTPWCIAWR